MASNTSSTRTPETIKNLRIVRPRWRRWLGAAVVMVLGTGLGEAATCEELRRLQLNDASVVETTRHRSGPLTVEGASARTFDLPAFCRVEAIATPTADSEITFEVWLPEPAAWNGRLLGTGNGGYSGAMPYRSLADGLARGYATVGSDTGHKGSDLSFAVGHPDRIADWGFRAVHVTTELAKRIVRAHQGRFPHHAYFAGCSTGGHQGLSEAQRYPRDYDGILAGAPGHNRVRLNAGFLWSWMATHRSDGTPILPVTKLPTITAAVVAACDASDGLQDGLIDDPRVCRFDPATIRCRGGDRVDCLTAEQVDVVRKVYAGARNPRTGDAVFVGWAPGSEAPDAGAGGWATYIIEPTAPMRVAFWRDWVFGDPTWRPETFDWDEDVAFADRVMASVAATDPDLRPFAARGGRLLLYAGWADAVVPPTDTVSYFQSVVDRLGGADNASEVVRLFMVPGVGHCGGGPGPDRIDGLTALVRWVEEGEAPTTLTASKIVEGAVTLTRPLCPYPQVARYRGEGSIDEAASFTCVVTTP